MKLLCNRRQQCAHHTGRESGVVSVILNQPVLHMLNVILPRHVHVCFPHFSFGSDLQPIYKHCGNEYGLQGTDRDGDGYVRSSPEHHEHEGGLEADRKCDSRHAHARQVRHLFDEVIRRWRGNDARALISGAAEFSPVSHEA